MTHKITAVFLAALIAVSAFSAYGVVLSDCAEQSCCCNGMAMAGGAENSDSIQSQRGCCCGAAAVSTCSLTMTAPSENMGWALSPNRVDPSGSPYFQAHKSVDPSFLPAVTFQLSTGDPVIHPASPPTYLTVMSFLC